MPPPQDALASGAEDLQRALDSLPDVFREAVVLRLRFGFEDDRRWTLEEIGAKIGVTRERARQIESEALVKLRHPRHALVLRTFLD